MSASAGEPRNTRRSRGWIRIAVIIAALAGLVVAVKFLPVVEYLNDLLTWVDGLGLWAPLVLILIWIPVCVLMGPGSILTLGTGFLFGVVKGTILVSIGSTLGASVSFLVGRKFARGWVGAKIAGDEKFAAIDRAVGREGWKIVLLTRLSPVIPFNLLNYGLSITRVRFWHYVLASWIGMLPGTIMYVYIGTTLKTLAEAAGSPDTGIAGKIAFFGGLALVVVVSIFITCIARKALSKATEEVDHEPSD